MWTKPIIMTNDEKLSPESFELCKSLAEIHNANARLEVLLSSTYVNGSSKHMMKRWKNNLDSVLREFKMKLPDAWRQTFEKELLNDEDSMQLDNCVTMLLQLPKGMKNECESYIESRNSIYSANKAHSSAG